MVEEALETVIPGLTRRQFLGTLLALCLPLIAFNAEARDVRKTAPRQSADISVSLDDTIKAMPELAADCRREGDRWAAKWRKQAAEAWRTDKFMRERGISWTVERNYQAVSVVGPYVSVLRTDYLNTGGAHPNTQMDTILWDGNANKRISIRPFFKETADGGPTMTALAAQARAAVIAEKKARDIPPDMIADPEWLKGIAPKLTAIGPVTLTPSTEADKSAGLTVHFSPYAVGPYVEGSYVVFVPWQKFKPYLSAAGAAIFAGMRPASDVKKYSP
jgi:hypothetical protein